MINSYQGKSPEIAEEVFVAPTAVIIGQVKIMPQSSIWFNTVLRGDVEAIYIGRGSNIQDATVVHGDPGFPVEVGKYVTVGHNCVLHGCKIGDKALIGMSATVLNGAEVGEGAIVGAGSLVTEGTSIPPKTLALGSPARVVRELTEEDIEKMEHFYQAYLYKAKEYKRMF